MYQMYWHVIELSVTGRTVKLKLECVVDVMMMLLQMSKGRGFGGGAIE